MSNLPPPMTPESSPRLAPMSAKSSWWRRRLAVPVWGVALAAIAVVGAISVAASTGNGKADSDASKAPTTASPAATAVTSEARSTTTSNPAATTTEKPTTTTSEEPTTTTELVTTTTVPAFGTRDNPIPLGIKVPAGDWGYTAVGFEVGVDPFLQEVNQFNTPAPAGAVAVRVRILAEYSGEGTGSPRGISVNLVGASGKTYGPSSPCCAGEIDALDDQAETFASGSVEGWIYYNISTDDATGKVLAFDPNINYTDVPGGVGFFAIN